MQGGTERWLPLTALTYDVLLALAEDACHGYGIIKEVERRSDGRTQLEAGTLYAAIKRMRDEGLIETASAPEEADSRRRYYCLTELGREVLRAESRRLESLVSAARSKNVLPEEAQ
ncbi:MAG TPA: PadR family transcriptional regulator [Acidobacteriota bacterium]|nr:PadR family transcriptional regulator [Acidobacteriota bacterium]